MDRPKRRCAAAMTAPFAALLLAALTLLFLPAAAQEQGPSAYWYEIETLNPGLGPAPDGLDRETPQLSLDGFLDAARRDDWDRAAHYLNLAGVEPARQRELGPDLARRLAKVIERKLWLDWSELSDRPDALVETGGSNNPLAGQPRKSQRLGILEAGNRPVVLRLDRVKPQAGEPVWVVSRRTVERVPALYAVHGPGWVERALPESWNSRVGGWELRRWELAALPLLLVLAVAIFLLLRWVFGWLARRAPWSVVRGAASAARMPVALLFTAMLLRMALGGIVTFSGPVTTVLDPVLLVLMIIGGASALLRAIDAGLDIVTERFVGEIDDAGSKDERSLYTSIYAARRIVLLIAFVLGAGLLLSQLHLTETLGVSLLASAGVLTVLLGIAGQAVLGNIFASLQIALGKPIRIGDSVYYEGDWAYVESIFYTFVRLRTWDDRRLIVPVKYFVSNPFENWTMKDAKMTRTFTLLLDHSADPDACREAFLQIVEEDEDAMPEEMKKMLVIDHDHNGQTLRFYATAADPSLAWNMHARLRERMLDWVRENHPEWWPRERVAEAGLPAERTGSGRTGRHGGAVGDAGG